MEHWPSKQVSLLKHTQRIQTKIGRMSYAIKFDRIVCN